MEVKLIVASGKNRGKEIPLPGRQFLIGRGEGCQLRPASERISRKHCAIIVAEGRVVARDLGSTNGTSVNNERLSGDRELKNGDKLNVGGVLEFEVQLSVDLAGKKGPKVHSIQEAAARTVKKAAADDLDITQWLDDAEQGLRPAPLVDLDLKNTSTVEQNMADTTTIQVPKDPKKEGKEKKDAKQEKEHAPRQKWWGNSIAARNPPPKAAATPPATCSVSFLAANGNCIVKASKDPAKKSAALLGVGLDKDDDQTRVTKGKNFLLWGGSKETHAAMQETALKINEHLDRRGKRLEDVSVKELREICSEVKDSVGEP